MPWLKWYLNEGPKYCRMLHLDVLKTNFRFFEWPFYTGFTVNTITNLEKSDPSEIERTYNVSKQQTLFLLSLFMRTNGKCNNSHAP